MRQLLAIIALTLLALAGASDSHAQGASSRTYLKMMDVQKLWDEQNYSEALLELQELAKKTADKPYDFAIVNQYMAHTYVFLDQYDDARRVLETALAVPDLTVQLTAEIKLIYGQIVLGDDQFELARDALEYWYVNTEAERQPSQIFSLGYANYMTDNLPRAEELLVIAIGETKKPSPSWYRLYYQVLFNQKKFREAEIVALGMIERDPYEPDNWRLLAGHFLQLEDSKAALAAITIAYNEGLLEGATDLKRMIALYGMMEIPEKAARLLETHLGDESIETDAEMLKRLGDLWLLSRERSKAKEFLLRAAELAPDGKTYEMLANIFFEDEDWEAAYDAYLEAIEQGGIDEPERLYLLAGISAQRDGKDNLARDAYNEAKKSDEHKRQAEALLRRLNEGRGS